MWQVRVYDVDSGSAFEGPDHTEWFPVEGIARRYAESLEGEGLVCLVLDLEMTGKLNEMIMRAMSDNG